MRATLSLLDLSCPCCSCTTDYQLRTANRQPRARAKSTAKGKGKGTFSGANSWSAGIKCECRRSSSTAQQSTAFVQRGLWLGAQSSSSSAACFPLKPWSFVIRLAARALRLDLSISHHALRPTRLTINLGRIRACIDHAAPLHDRSDRCAHHCNCTQPRRPRPKPSPPPCAHLQLSSTRVRRRRQQREAQTVCVCPRASSIFTLAATAPGRVQRHWRVK